MAKLTAIELDAIFLNGENQNIEFKYGTLVPDSLAKCIAAFANTDGGTIIIGYSERQNKLFSSSWKDHGIVERCIKYLDDPPKINIYDVQYKGFLLLIVEIAKNIENLTYYKGALYVRVGDQVSLMSKDAIKIAFSSKVNNSSEALLFAIEKMNIKNEELRNQIDAHNSWAIDNSKKSLIWAIALCVAGSILGAVLGAFISNFILSKVV